LGDEVSLAKGRPYFNSDKKLEDAKYDGYYAIVTSELHRSDSEVISTYRFDYRSEISDNV